MDRILRAVRILFVLNAGIWTVFGFVTLGRGRSSGVDSLILVWIIALLMFANAGALLGVGLFIGSRRRWVFPVALALLAANILLTLTDEVGFFDWVTLGLDLVLLILLLLFRLQALRSRGDGGGNQNP